MRRQRTVEILLLIVASSAASSCKSPNKVAEHPIEPASSPSAKPPYDSISELISKNSSFTDCRVQGLVFVPYEATDADAVGYRTGNLTRDSDIESVGSLRLLYKTGYIRLQDSPIFENRVFWAPTEKANRAMGPEIQSERIALPIAPGYPDAGTYAAYRWTLILGCRQL